MPFQGLSYHTAVEKYVLPAHGFLSKIQNAGSYFKALNGLGPGHLAHIVQLPLRPALQALLSGPSEVRWLVTMARYLHNAVSLDACLVPTLLF